MGTGINKAAREHGVPATTLKDRLSGHVAHGTKPGPRPNLSIEEETELGTFLVCPANATPSGIRRKSLPRARLLTSAESLTMLKEKEKKQQDEKEQKEKRKKEREEKKKQREADMKRKAEERAKKTEERAKKAEVKAQKAAEKKRTRGEKKECRGAKLGSISLKEEQSQ